MGSEMVETSHTGYIRAQAVTSVRVATCAADKAPMDSATRKTRDASSAPRRSATRSRYSVTPASSPHESSPPSLDATT
ncbi:hypothetical protein ASG28_09915 [Frigoribacterium sp. Leaf415]|nr:hypothetical protein ASF07_09910 [Frigoribacterium sp. Leaf254]KQT39835.1 hypothetical protein ASG28_09915 [Frigoribacterium sp. Leaf415]